MNGIHYFEQQIIVGCVTITTLAKTCHFRLWMMMVRQKATRWYCGVKKFVFIGERENNPRHLDWSRSIPVTHGG